MMRYRHNKGYRYRITNPPRVLLKARMDNIAIVPASMLPLTETLKAKVNTLPQGGVVLCYSAENTRQRKLLERVGETFREHGHTVMHLSMGEAYTTSRTFEFLLSLGVGEGPWCNNRKAGNR